MENHNDQIIPGSKVKFHSTYLCNLGSTYAPQLPKLRNTIFKVLDVTNSHYILEDWGKVTKIDCGINSLILVKD